MIAYKTKRSNTVFRSARAERQLRRLSPRRL